MHWGYRRGTTIADPVSEGIFFFNFNFAFYFLKLIFETESHVAHVGLRLLILLPLTPEGWGTGVCHPPGLCSTGDRTQDPATFPAQELWSSQVPFDSGSSLTRSFSEEMAQ